MNETKVTNLVFVCSGAADVGELTDRAAVELSGRRACQPQRRKAERGRFNRRRVGPADITMTLKKQDAAANHRQLQERNATHRRFGFDPDASVRFVLAQALPLPGRVLDIGTGKGRFVVPLARHVANVTTVDVNGEEQHQARLEAAYAGVSDRIRFVVQDARWLPWPAGSFDAVTSWNVFHHLDDPERVFSEMLRVLKPGGKLVLADFSPSGFRLMDEIHAAEGRRHPHPPSRFAHWQAWLRSAGFAVLRLMDHHQEVLIGRRSFDSVPNPARGNLE